MAVPAYATDLTDIYTDTDNFVTVGGGRVTAAETDDYIQGNNCWSHDPFSSGIEGGAYDATTAPTITAGDAVFIWTKCDVAATLATHAAGGVQIIMGDSSSDYDCFYVRGSDDYAYGGWQCIPVDPTKTPSTSVGTPATNDHFGVRWNVPSSGAAKGYPMKIDAIRYGKTLEVTAGDATTPATWDDTAIYDSTTTRQWGICQPTDSGAAIQGNVYWGTASTAVYSRDSNRTIVVNDTEWTDTDFTQVIFAHASNDIIWDNVGLLALGTNNRGIIDVTVNPSTNGMEWTNSVYQGIDSTTLLADCVFDGSKWLSTNEVDAGGASLLNCKILTPTIVADTSALIWNVATNPDGILDGMEFSEGTNAHHAIEFGTSAPLAITLNNMDFTGFTTTNALNNSTFYIARTSGAETVTINLVSCTGNFSYKTAGANVSLVVDPVSTIVTAIDISGNDVDDVSVGLFAKDATGPLPFEDSISISNSGTTATVTHTAHGMITGDKVLILGGDQPYNRGVYSITVTGVNAYTYTTGTAPSGNPTGCTATWTSIYQVLSSTNTVTVSRTFSSDQPVTGWVRKSTSTPLYQTAPVTGTISSANGLNLTALMLSDE